MNKLPYQIIIGDNSFFINLNESMINILKSSFNKDVKFLEVNKKNSDIFEDDAAKVNAKTMYDTMTQYNWSISGKIKFINEFMELLIQEKNSLDDF
jgi:hypothetical protein